MEKRLKEARKLRKLTLKEVADLISVSESAVSNFERGRNNPSGPTLTLFCQKLQISESWLRTGEGEMEEKDLLTELTVRYNLGPAGQALLRAVARAFAELDEETASRVVDEALAELQAFVASRSVVVADPSSRLVDPQAPADQDSSSASPGSVVS